MRSQRHIMFVLVASVGLIPLLTGCADHRALNDTELQALQSKSALTIERFKRSEKSMDHYFKDSVGYAVFPTVAKGGLIVGGAHGIGLVYEPGGKVIGTASISEGTIGPQIGGQVFSEILFFQDDPTFDHFKEGNIEMRASGSAVAAGSGSSATARYAQGMAVFVLGEEGLMLAASIGGQGFDYVPLETVAANAKAKEEAARAKEKARKAREAETAAEAPAKESAEESAEK